MTQVFPWSLHYSSTALASERSRIQEFLDSRHINVVTLSALCIARLYCQEISLVLISVRG